MIDSLVRASVEGAVMVGGIWIISRALPLSPAVKAILWWCAAAKVLVTVLWGTPLIVPVLPAVVVERQVVGEAAGGTIAGARTVETLDAVPAAALRPQGFNWTFVALALWAAGAGLAAGAGCRQWRRIRATIGRSEPAGPAAAAIAREIAAHLSLGRLPAIRLSDDIESPLVTGLLRPVVLLPATRFPLMDINQQRMTICHEFAHLKRGDLWFGCVPAIAERIFFFHPLVRLAAREYSFWREAACDAAVLRALGTAPQAYGRLLLDLGISRPRPALIAAGAAWSFPNLKRRIVMLQQPTPSRPAARLIAGVIIAVTAVAIAPLRLGAREAVLPPLPPLSTWLPIARMPTPALPPDAHIYTPLSEAQEKRLPPRQREELRFVLMSEDTTNMSGNRGDIERARRLRQGGETMLWFMRGGQEYVVRDPEALKQVQQLWEPVSRIGAEQGSIGATQGELGEKQAEIGARQGHIAAQQAQVGARQAEIGARQAALAAREARQAAEREQVELRAERRALEAKMQDLERDMATLGKRLEAEGKPMEKLGAEMDVLGEQMSALGKQMDEASRQAEDRMRSLIERTVASGTARPVR